MPRQVLSISSQVAFGPVGNTAAVPALQAAGFAVLQVPTIILSNHPGLGKPSGVKLPATEIQAILNSLENLGVLASCAGVMTGYFADADQITIAADCIRKMKGKKPDLFILVDPVLGDDNSLYVSKDIAEAIRSELLPLASCITPNAFELGWLSGHTISNKNAAIAAATALGIAEVLATSIPVDADTISTMAISKDGCAEITSAFKASVPHGTGDFLSGLYLACRLNGYEASQALDLSSAILNAAISRSEGSPSLDIIGALYGH